MATVGHSSLFFNLPLELREEVYRSALTSSAHGPALLQTCREVYSEARKFLYQRPLTFQSQEALYAWLADKPTELLNEVSEISLKVQDVDLKPILTSGASTDRPRISPRLMTWDLYQAELNRLEQALRRLPETKAITIRALSGQHSILYQEFMSRTLELLVPLFPDLRGLRLDGRFPHRELGFLSNLKHLESFSFDGFSTSSPRATFDVFSNLRFLKNLSLFSQHALLPPTIDKHSDFITKRQSFTSDILGAIRRDTPSIVTEQAPPSSPGLFFISEVISSLHENGTLESLSIQLSHTPDEETLATLETFLGNSSIRWLELDWPDMQPAILERYRLLTGDLKILWVRVVSEADSFETLWSIFESREAGNLRKLKKVVLIRSTEAFEERSKVAHDRKDSGVGNVDPSSYTERQAADDQERVKIARARFLLRSLGVHVAWCTADT